MERPDPIPNSEVKRLSADDSMPATVCENRSVPGHFYWFSFLISGNLNLLLIYFKLSKTKEGM